MVLGGVSGCQGVLGVHIGCYLVLGGSRGVFGVASGC